MDEDDFAHSNEVESYTMNDMQAIMHSAQGAESTFFRVMFTGEMDSQQTSSSRDMGEGSPTPRQAPHGDAHTMTTDHTRPARQDLLIEERDIEDQKDEQGRPRDRQRVLATPGQDTMPPT